jgi:hypothetical protein
MLSRCERKGEPAVSLTLPGFLLRQRPGLASLLGNVRILPQHWRNRSGRVFRPERLTVTLGMSWRRLNIRRSVVLQQCLVIGASRYDFEDEKDKTRRIKGGKCEVVQPRTDSADGTGSTVVDLSMPYEVFASLDGKLPAMCEVMIGLKPDSKTGKAVATALSVKVVAPVNLGGAQKA